MRRDRPMRTLSSSPVFKISYSRVKPIDSNRQASRGDTRSGLGAPSGTVPGRSAFMACCLRLAAGADDPLDFAGKLGIEPLNGANEFAAPFPRRLMGTGFFGVQFEHMVSQRLKLIEQMGKAIARDEAVQFCGFLNARLIGQSE